MERQNIDEPQVPPEFARATLDNFGFISAAVFRLLDKMAEHWASVSGEPLDAYRLDFKQGFLMELLAAMQLLAWEQRQIFVHREVGLPSADEAIQHAFESWSSFPDSEMTPLQRAVFRLWIERFAWTAREDLNADVAVDPVDEEILLEYLADYLWTHRHAAMSGKENQ
jgi:hypothetical protein